jgi:phosphoglycolate phosphatase
VIPVGDRAGEPGFAENEVHPGIPDLLGAVTAAGLSTAVATSKVELHAEAVVEHFGLRAWLPVVAGADLQGRRFAGPDAVVATLDDLRALVLV